MFPKIESGQLLPSLNAKKSVGGGEGGGGWLGEERPKSGRSNCRHRKPNYPGRAQRVPRRVYVPWCRNYCSDSRASICYLIFGCLRAPFNALEFVREPRLRVPASTWRFPVVCLRDRSPGIRARTTANDSRDSSSRRCQ